MMGEQTEISDYIRAGKKLKAVCLARAHMGLSLNDAKKYVESLEATMTSVPSHSNHSHHRAKIILAIICGSMAIIGVVAILTHSSNITECLPPTIIFAILAIIFGVLSIKAPKTKIEDVEHKITEIAANDLYFAPNDISLIDGMEGHEFEYFCADLLEMNSFFEVNVTKGSGDQGVDILAIKDGIKYAIQCKNYASPLGNTPVQEVNAGRTFYNCHVGVVLTNSTFTPGAKALAQATGVLLWDRAVLQKMMDEQLY